MAIEASIGLRRDLDLDEIACRLAGLPIHLPPDFVREWGQKLLEIEVEGRIGRKESPLLALLRLRALASAGAQQIDLTSGVQALADALRDRGELMVAIVRYAASQALHRTDWRSLTPAARVTLLWVYADQMTQILAPPGVDLREVAEWVENKIRLDLMDNEAQSDLPEWVTYLTAHLSLERLSGAIVASLVREGLLARLSDESIQVLGQLCGPISEQGWLPFISIVQPPPPAPAVIWASEDALGPLVEAGWVQSEHPFAARNDTDLASRLLDSGIDPNYPYLVPVMLSFVDVRRVDANLLPRLKETLDAADGEMALEPEFGGVHRILSVRAAVLARLDIVEAMHDALARQARRCADNWPEERLQFGDNRSTSGAALAMLIEATFSHASALPRPPFEQMTIFANGVRTIVDVWPKSSRQAAARMDRISRQMNTEIASAIWPACWICEAGIDQTFQIILDSSFKSSGKPNSFQARK